MQMLFQGHEGSQQNKLLEDKDFPRGEKKQTHKIICWQRARE